MTPVIATLESKLPSEWIARLYQHPARVEGLRLMAQRYGDCPKIVARFEADAVVVNETIARFEAAYAPLVDLVARRDAAQAEVAEADAAYTLGTTDPQEAARRFLAVEVAKQRLLAEQRELDAAVERARAALPHSGLIRISQRPEASAEIAESVAGLVERQMRVRNAAPADATFGTWRDHAGETWGGFTAATWSSWLNADDEVVLWLPWAVHRVLEQDRASAQDAKAKGHQYRPLPEKELRGVLGVLLAEREAFQAGRKGAA